MNWNVRFTWKPNFHRIPVEFHIFVHMNHLVIKFVLRSSVCNLNTQNYDTYEVLFRFVGFFFYHFLFSGLFENKTTIKIYFMTNHQRVLNTRQKCRVYTPND